MNAGLGGTVAIIGTGTIKFGENFHQSLTDMIYKAVTLALADAGVATGIEAVRNAALAVASGEYDLVLAVGAGKMREVPSRGSLVAQAVNRGHPVLAKGRIPCRPSRSFPSPERARLRPRGGPITVN